ncbi:MAG: hypothetical protein GKS07_11175 [Nitrosopumilus sp.]|nr:MAG: hypothetical protein GKS07_11175 [Nitrosopumilus sp.]
MQSMNRLVLSSTVFILFAGLFGTFANAEEIPSWVKNNAQYWADDSIDDATFINALQFLIAEQIITIPETEVTENQSGEIPSWIKNNVQYWAQDAITDLDFINGIQYLIANGIIVIEYDDVPKLSLSGNFSSGDFFHQTSGSTNIEFSSEKTILHLGDDFKTVNGPDLYVYLATDKQAKDYVSLGMIQKFSGLQSYDVPDDVDLEKYGEVLIWCKSFGVLFGNAPLEK